MSALDSYRAGKSLPGCTSSACFRTENYFPHLVCLARVEIASDLLYKQKLARGFLHLADGQEAVPTGMEAALTFKDSIIQVTVLFVGSAGLVKLHRGADR